MWPLGKFRDTQGVCIIRPKNIFGAWVVPGLRHLKHLEFSPVALFILMVLPLQHELGLLLCAIESLQAARLEVGTRSTAAMVMFRTVLDIGEAFIIPSRHEGTHARHICYELREGDLVPFGEKILVYVRLTGICRKESFVFVRLLTILLEERMPKTLALVVLNPGAKQTQARGGKCCF